MGAGSTLCSSPMPLAGVAGGTPAPPSAQFSPWELSIVYESERFPWHVDMLLPQPTHGSKGATAAGVAAAMGFPLSYLDGAGSGL
jgi:hypothetical protein